MARLHVVRHLPLVPNAVHQRATQKLERTLTAAPELGSGRAEALSEYAENPIEFFDEILGIKVWSKQEDITKSVLQEEETWVRASHGVGKTMIAACLAEYWLSARGRSVITTAPTMRQVRELLWQQLRTNRMMARRPVVGRCLTTEVKVDGYPNWFARGFSTDNPENAQGPHSDEMLIIVDEAAGVAAWLWDAIKGWMTNPGVRLLAIGNPNQKRNRFRAAFFERRGEVSTIHIDAEKSPNVVAGKVVVPGLTTREWVEARGKEWGKGSVQYLNKVRGEFGSDSEEKILPMEWLDEAFELGEEMAAWEATLSEEHRKKLLAIIKAAGDIARAGKDKCALVYLAGQRIRIALYFDEPDTMKTAGRFRLWIRDLSPDGKPRWFIIDANAVGGPVYDRCAEMAEEIPEDWGPCQLVPLDWGGTPDEPARYVKVVDELYGRLRHRINPDTAIEERLGLPTREELAAVGLTRDELAAQLNARKFRYTDRGQVKVETKSELAKRAKETGGVTSPDLADAIAALLYTPIERDLKVTFFR